MASRTPTSSSSREAPCATTLSSRPSVTPRISVSIISSTTRSRCGSSRSKANPGGSIKDRIALSMVEDAEQRGVLRPGSVGDRTHLRQHGHRAGAGLRREGLPPHPGDARIHVSIERRKLMTALRGRAGAHAARAGHEGLDRAAPRRSPQRCRARWIAAQFANPANLDGPPLARPPRRSSRDFPEGLDYMVTGVGTGGHITGCAEVLKERLPGLKVYRGRAARSRRCSRAASHAPHPIQGIGAGFIPDVAPAGAVRRHRPGRTGRRHGLREALGS